MDKICVLGGGASGMAAAITLAQNHPDIPIIILEKNSQLGKKLLATGNGRCNITNSSVIEEEGIIEFLDSVGILTREEDDGRVYPFSGKAQDVVQLLCDSLDALGVKVIYDFTVNEIESRGSDFLIRGYNSKNRKAGKEVKELKCAKVVVALGGKASPQFGTIGEGYGFLKILGLHVTKIFPGLTWIESSKGPYDLHGIRVKGSAQLFRKGELIAIEKGEIQFSKNGLSGISIFNLSSQVVLGNGYSFEDYKISIDLMTDQSLNQVRALIEARSKLPKMTIGNLLKSIVPSPLDREILSRGNASLENMNSQANTLNSSELTIISQNIKGLEFSIKGIGGWKDAQITIGGVSLDEVNHKTWESHSIPGLYVVGELLDQQGPCGGYNLHNAWKTGIEAGKALGK